MDEPTAKQKSIANLEAKIAAEQKYLEIMKQFPDDLPAYLITAYDWGMCIYIAANWDTYRELRRKLGKDFERIGNPEPRKDGNAIDVFLRHIPTGTRIDVYMSTDQEGATCRKVMTGEVVTPVYEIVCD